jgi:malate dehydrogenase (oxaloacetate-decarboxylating)
MLRDTSVAVATAVARAAAEDGAARAPIDGDLPTRIRSLMWKPSYRPIIPE